MKTCQINNFHTKIYTEITYPKLRNFEDQSLYEFNKFANLVIHQAGLM